MSKSRTIAANLGTFSGVGGASVSFIESDGLLPSADLTGDSGDLIFSRSTNAMFVGEGTYYRRFTTSSLATLQFVSGTLQ